MQRIRIAVATFLLLAPFAANAVVITGTISDWPESGPLEVIGDGTNSVSMFWSINTFDRGFMYGTVFTGDTDIAVATGVSDISDIIDASIFTFTSDFVGPVCDADCASNGVGDFIVHRNIFTGYYGVLRIDDIVVPGNDFFSATLNGTWWFQTDGSSSFGPTPVPEPGALALLGLGILGMGMVRRKKA